MKYRIILLALAAWILAFPAKAQYRAIASCPGATALQPAGSSGAIALVDVNGNLCISGTITPSGTQNVAIADGADMTLGAKADPVCPTAAGTCSLEALIKFLNTAASGPIPLNINAATIAQTGLTPGVAQTGTIIAANIDATSKGGVAYGAMANFGTTPGAVRVDGVNASLFIGNTAWPTGTGAIGATIPRVGLAVDQATNSGAALVKGGVGTVNGGSTWNTIAASQTAQSMSSTQAGGTGAVGDYLSHCVVQPGTTSPGVVTVFDGTNTATNDAIAFPGGASSVSNLVPFAIPVGSISINSGGWKVTTGANVTVTCYGKFT